MSKAPLWNWNFLSICFTNLFVFLAHFMMIATFPIYAVQSLQASPGRIGLIMTVYVIAAIAFRPLAGIWLDRFSRKKILVFSLVLFFAVSVLYLGAHSFILFLVLRFVHGIGFSLATTAASTIASDIVPNERKGEGIGYFALSLNLAMVLGPFLGLTVAGQNKFTLLLLAGSAMGVLALLCGGATRISNENKAAKEKTPLFKNIVEPSALPISLTMLVLTFAYSGILTFISVYAMKIGLAQAASYFFIVYAAMIMITRPLLGKLFDRYGEHKVIYPSLILFLLGLILLSQVHTAVLFFVSAALIGLGFGSLFPIAQTIVIKHAPAEKRGLATGTYFICYDTGICVGSYVLGLVATSFTYQAMYLVAAFFVIVGASFYFAVYHKRHPLNQDTTGALSSKL